MDDLLNRLKSGVVTLAKKFDDGSLTWFQATASEPLLRARGYSSGIILDLTNKKVLDLQDLESGLYFILTNEDKDNINSLDIYMNRGIAGEYN